MPNLKLLNYHDYHDKTKFNNIVEYELKKRFNTDVYNLPENYGKKVDWGLLTILDKNIIDTYTLLYVDDECWSGAGGIIRYVDNQMIYQGLFRLFSRATLLHNSLGMKSYTYKYILPMQIERARFLNCDSLVITFNSNESNKQLYNVIKNYHIPKIFGKDLFKSVDEPVLFNGVYQWLLKIYLK